MRTLIFTGKIIFFKEKVFSKLITCLISFRNLKNAPKIQTRRNVHKTLFIKNLFHILI